METKRLYVSLHTDNPTNQSDKEISYSGYERQIVDYDNQFGQKSLVILFPQLTTQKEEFTFTHMAIGHKKSGVGALEKVIECIPHVHVGMLGAPRIIVANIPEPLPDDLHPIARVLWNLVNTAQVAAENLPPELFRTLNDELERVGVPVLKITRSGVAKMDVKMTQMKSLNLQH